MNAFRNLVGGRGGHKRGRPMTSLLEEAMDSDQPSNQIPHQDPACSICLELVVLDRGDRSTAKLQCGHQFHLDCIGSAFNAKGEMQCPNCRKVEKGHWLCPSGQHPSTDFELDAWIDGDIRDASFSELPFGFQWCPFRGLTQLTSFFQESEPRQNPLLGDHSSGSNSRHVCPYLALHGIPHVMHNTPSAGDSTLYNGFFHWHLSSLGGQLSATDPQNQNWLQHRFLPFSLSRNADLSASHLGSSLSRNDYSTQQRLGSFPPHFQGPITPIGSNIVVPLGQPFFGGVRGQTHGHGTHIYQQTVPFSTLQASGSAPYRRTRQRGLTLVSSTPPSSPAEMDGFYVSRSVDRTYHDANRIVGRNFEPFPERGREGAAPVLIPVEGDSQWWAPFHPSSQHSMPANRDSMAMNLFPQRGSGERVARSWQENAGYCRMLPPRYM